MKKEYENSLSALENGESLTPSSDTQSSQVAGQKRKHTHDGKDGPYKRRKSALNSDEDDKDEDVHADNDDDDNGVDSDMSSLSELKYPDESTADDDEEEEEGKGDEEDETGGSLDGSDNSDTNSEFMTNDFKAKIVEAKEAIKAGREDLTEARKEKKEAIDQITALKKRGAEDQKQKNAFCSLKRSEVSFMHITGC
jgi:hypothetical protein